MCPYKNLYINVYNIIIHNSQKVETTQMSISWWMDKQNVVYPYKGILLVNKKKWSTDTCYSMDDPWKHYAKWKNQATKRPYIIWFHLYKMSRIGKAIETEKSISGCLGLGGHLGVEEWGMSANGYRVCFRRGENILKLNCGKGLPWWRSGWESACQCRGHGVRDLVREDPTCRRATKPVRHNYWACALEPASHNYWSPRT